MKIYRCVSVSFFEPLSIFQDLFSMRFRPVTMAKPCCGPCTVSAVITSSGPRS